MVVRGSADTPNLRITLVHELTHALDDQHFELDRPELDDASDESGFGVPAAGRGQRLPGGATPTRRRSTDDERAQADAEQLEALDRRHRPRRRSRRSSSSQQEFVYSSGPGVRGRACSRQGGNAAIDEALREPADDQRADPRARRLARAGRRSSRCRVPEADGRGARRRASVGQVPARHLLTGLIDAASSRRPSGTGTAASSGGTATRSACAWRSPVTSTASRTRSSPWADAGRRRAWRSTATC